MIMSHLFGLFCILLFVSCSFCVSQTRCDPFNGYQTNSTSTCTGSSIEWYADNSGLHVSSSIVACEASRADLVSVATVDFFPTLGRAMEIQEFYFEYSIQWLTDAANCVVDLFNISSNSSIVDQNGLSNSPLEDLSQYAVNSTYLRRFYINTAPRSILADARATNFQLICASRENGTSEVLISSVTILTRQYSSKSLALPISDIYHKSYCSDCVGSSYELAECTMIEGYSTPQWIFNGTLNTNGVFIRDDSSLFVFGDLNADLIYFDGNNASIVVHGCVNPKIGSIKYAGTPNQSFKISFNDGCTVPTIICDFDYCYLQITNSSTAITISHAPFNDGNDEPGAAAYAEMVNRGIILGLVFGCVGFAGLVVGAVFLIRYWNRIELRREAKRMQELQSFEMVQSQTNNTTGGGNNDTLVDLSP